VFYPDGVFGSWWSGAPIVPPTPHPPAQKRVDGSHPWKRSSVPMCRCPRRPLWRRMQIAGPEKLLSVTVIPLMGEHRTTVASSRILWAPIPCDCSWPPLVPLWCIVSSEQHGDVVLQRFRPWYRHKVAPSQCDVAEACREVLQEAGIFPIPRFFPAVAENQQEGDTSKPIAA